jgi:hypothetical protein
VKKSEIIAEIKQLETRRFILTWRLISCRSLDESEEKELQEVKHRIQKLALFLCAKRV